MAVAQHPIIGSWSLVRWQIRHADGHTSYPFGSEAHGRLLYSATGQMLACIAAAQRPSLSTAVPKNATDPEKAAAFDGYFSYGGPFEIDGDDVLHYVEMSLNPNFVGSVQRRHMAFTGNRLTLSASEPSGSGSRNHELIWEAL